MKGIKFGCAMLICVLVLLSFTNCKKPPGPGGKATVQGKIFATDFDNSFRYVLSKRYTSGEDVFICYGNNTVVGGNVKSSTDGSFQFRYLNKGHYKVFANSLDTTIKVKGNKTKIAVVREFDITGTTQVITLDDLLINR